MVSGSERTTRLLLEHGALRASAPGFSYATGSVSFKGETALFVAATGGSLRMVQVTIQCAHVTRKNGRKSQLCMVLCAVAARSGGGPAAGNQRVAHNRSVGTGKGSVSSPDPHDDAAALSLRTISLNYAIQRGQARIPSPRMRQKAICGPAESKVRICTTNHA